MNQELKEKIVVAFEELTPNQLITDIHLTDEEYSTLIEMTKIRVASLLSRNATLPPPDETLSLALVQIGIREYEDGNYWDNFDIVLDKSFTAAKHMYFGLAFFTTLEKYHLFKYKAEKTINKNQYVQNILMHGMVPRRYYHDFFTFMVSFYETNLLKNIPENLDDSFDDLCIFMMEALKSKKEDIGLDQISGKPSKYYKLLKSTQRVLAEEKITTPRKTMSEVLYAIDQYYWYGEISELNKNTLIQIALSEWLQSKPEELHERDRISSGGHRRLFNQKPYLRLNHNEFCIELVIPPRKIRESEFEGDVYVQAQTCNETKNYTLDSYRGYGVINTEEKIIPIDEGLFSEIIIEVYSAVALPCYIVEPQDYRFFSIDEDFFEIGSIVKGNSILVTKPGVDVNFPEGSHVLLSDPQELGFATLYYIAMDEDSVFYINDVPISLSMSLQEGVVFSEKITEVQFYNQLRKEIVASKEHPCVYLMQKKTESILPVLVVNGERVEFNETQIKKIPIPNDLDNIGIKLDLMQILPIVNKEFKITVLSSDNSTCLDLNYLLLKNFRIEQDEKFYFFRNKAKIKFHSDISITSREDLRLLSYNEFEITLTKTNYVFSFELDQHYQFRYNCPVFLWSFDCVTWRSDQPDFIWIDDLKHNLFISCPNVDKIKLVCDSNFRHVVGNRLDNNIYGFDVKQLNELCSGLQNDWDHILVCIDFYDHSIKHFNLFKVLTSVIIEKFSLKETPDGHYECDIQYLGKGDLYINVLSLGSYEFVYKMAKLNQGITKLPRVLVQEAYRFYVYDESYVSSNSNEIPKPLLTDVILPSLVDYVIYLKSIVFEDEIFDIHESGYTIRDIQESTNSFEEYYGNLLKITPGSDNPDRKYWVKITKQVSISRVIIQCWDADSREWTNMVLDKERHELLSIDDDLLNTPGGSMDRFLFLYEEEVDFEVECRRVDK